MKRLDWSLYWVAPTALGVWFLFIHSPPLLIHRDVLGDPLFLAHLIGVYALYLACMNNSLLTPKLSECIRLLHIWAGRFGLICGVVGFLSGLVLTWTRVGSDDLGFSIFISIGGVIQMGAEYKGYHAIKKYQELKKQVGLMTGNELFTLESLVELQVAKDKSVKDHIAYMVVLFVMACGIPAIIRVLDAGGLGDDLLPIFVAMGFMNILTLAYTRKLQSQVGPKSGEMQGLVERIGAL